MEISVGCNEIFDGIFSMSDATFIVITWIAECTDSICSLLLTVLLKVIMAEMGVIIEPSIQ